MPSTKQDSAMTRETIAHPEDGLDQLIKRLEDAKEGSRELDREVALVSGWRRMGSEHRPHGGWYWRGGPNDCTGTQVDNEHPPHYTTSLDAALTLVPEGWNYALNSNGAIPVADVYQDVENDRWPSASTMALALCIAALKARQAMLSARASKEG